MLEIHYSISPIIALLAGIIILLWPDILYLVIAVYLIVIGILGLIGTTA